MQQPITGAGLAVLAAVVAAGSWHVLQPVTAPVTTTPKVAAQPADSPRPYALFIGDSYFMGSGGVSKLSSMAFLAGEQLGYEPMVSGSGAGVGFVRARPETDEQPGAKAFPDEPDLFGADWRPEVIIVEGGLNDRGLDPAAVQAGAVRTLAHAAAAWPDAPVVLVGPPLIPGNNVTSQTVVRDALAAAAEEADVPFVDATTWVDDRVPIGPDGTHPTLKGSKVLADRLTEALRDLDLAAS